MASKQAEYRGERPGYVVLDDANAEIRWFPVEELKQADELLDRFEKTAERLIESYGDDPTEVGAEDGTEDDFGDLIHEALSGLTGDDTSREDWEKVEEVATASDSTSMREWLAQVARAL